MDVNVAIKMAMRNKNKLNLHGKKVGCFHCLKIFESKEIVSYTDQGETALCPFCEVDAVIPDTDNLEEIKKYWFD